MGKNWILTLSNSDTFQSFLCRHVSIIRKNRFPWSGVCSLKTSRETGAKTNVNCEYVGVDQRDWLIAGFLWQWHCETFCVPFHKPDRHAPSTFVLQIPLFNIPELPKLCRSNDLDALKLWKSRSGSMADIATTSAATRTSINTAKSTKTRRVINLCVIFGLVMIFSILGSSFSARFKWELQIVQRLIASTSLTNHEEKSQMTKVWYHPTKLFLQLKYFFNQKPIFWVQKKRKKKGKKRKKKKKKKKKKNKKKCMKFVRRILKLLSCERVGRVIQSNLFGATIVLFFSWLFTSLKSSMDMFFLSKRLVGLSLSRHWIISHWRSQTHMM